MHELRLIAVAVQFLTRLPVPGLAAFELQWLHDSARHFATVGLLVGALVAAALWVAAAVWPLPLAAVLALAAGIAITGAFHEDGLADTWDALGGAVSRERALAIMKDSRLGTYGTLALGVVLAAKTLALLAIAQHQMTQALWASIVLHAASRAGAVGVIATLAYAGDEVHAKAKPLARSVGPVAPAVGLAVAAAAALAAGWAGVPASALGAALAAAGIAVAATALWLRRRLGGYTGDGLGAAQQHAETAGLLAWAAWLP
jgi:adenosylcobinamide-GDP ribazoletransferase